MDRQVKIDKVEYRTANTQRGTIPVADVFVTALDNQKMMKVAIWNLTQDMWTYKAGDKVTMTIEEKVNGQYTNYSTKLASITDIPSAVNVPTKPGNSVPASVWAEKDQAMRKMNALSHAVAIVNMEFPNPQGEDTRTELVIKVADRLVSFINVPKEEEELETAPF